jgi:hypothetical protein
LVKVDIDNVRNPPCINARKNIIPSRYDGPRRLKNTFIVARSQMINCYRLTVEARANVAARIEIFSIGFRARPRIRKINRLLEDSR